MSIKSISSPVKFNNSKLFFSKKELYKILSCYSIGDSNGKWKDYSIKFDKYEANFLIYKHTKSLPYCIITKYLKNKKNKFNFQIKYGNKNNKKSENIENLIAILKRKNFQIV
tara:strand:+ start:123 stop:458 length:336 start_codon:yes stop_codon:yes gene_type:complete